tara:strand:+ start:128 stop:268 length:141 start_codon:yes stop_codon:yes gene_type:complete
VAALMSSTNAINIGSTAGPDVFGQNGENFTNMDPRVEFAEIGINLT